MIDSFKIISELEQMLDKLAKKARGGWMFDESRKLFLDIGRYVYKATNSLEKTKEILTELYYMSLQEFGD